MRDQRWRNRNEKAFIRIGGCRSARSFSNFRDFEGHPHELSNSAHLPGRDLPAGELGINFRVGRCGGNDPLP